jgi:hypothetical protein
MNTNVTLFGRIRKLLEAVDAEPIGGADAEFVTDQQLNLMVAQGAMPYATINQAGRSFWTGTTAALAAVVAIPTTGNMLTIYNNNPDGGRSLIVDWVAASGVAKTAAAGQAQLLALIGQLRDTAPATAGFSIKKRNGYGGTLDTGVIPATAALSAQTGVAANWFPLGPAVGFPGAAATPGHGLYARLDGDIIVPPGRVFAMHVLADVVGSTFLGFIGWHEKMIALA